MLSKSSFRASQKPHRQEMNPQTLLLSGWNSCERTWRSRRRSKRSKMTSSKDTSPLETLPEIEIDDTKPEKQVLWASCFNCSFTDLWKLGGGGLYWINTVWRVQCIPKNEHSPDFFQNLSLFDANVMPLIQKLIHCYWFPFKDAILTNSNSV